MQSADSVSVCRSGLCSLRPEELLPGDVVLLEAGHKVPADVRVLCCTASALVDNSALTGESVAEPRSSEPVAMGDQSPALALVEAPNVLFAGTSVVEGRLAGGRGSSGKRTFKEVLTYIYIYLCVCAHVCVIYIYGRNR